MASPSVRAALGTLSRILVGGEDGAGWQDVSVQDAVQALEGAAQDVGLLAGEVHELVSLVLDHAGAALGTSDAVKLVQTLLPVEHVSSGTVVDVLGGLGQAPLALQLALLKWLALVLDYVDRPEDVHVLYGAFFQYLGYETLRPPLCELLFRLTRRGDVRGFRLRRIEALFQRFGGAEPWLAAVRSLFHEYADSAFAVAASSAASGPSKVRNKFQKHSKRWLESLQRVRVQHRDRRRAGHSGDGDGHDDADDDADVEMSDHPAAAPRSLPFGLESQRELSSSSSSSSSSSLSSVLRHKRSRQQMSSVPPIPSPLASVSSSSGHRVTYFAEIGNGRELVEALPRLQLPSQLSAMLNNRFMQHWTLLAPSNASLLRVTLWLGSLLEEEVLRGRPPSYYRDTKALMRVFLDVYAVMQDLPVEVEKWVLRVLRQWNGAAQFSDELFELLSVLPCRSFADLYQYVLHPLHRLYFTSSAQFKAAVIRCYTRMLRNWMREDWKSFVQLGSEGRRATFSHLNPEVDHFRVMRKFIEHVDQLCVLGLIAENDSMVLADATLGFFEGLAKLSDAENPLKSATVMPFVSIPSPLLMYRWFLSSSGVVVSRMCGIMASYKMAYDQFRGTVPTKRKDVPINFSPGAETSISVYNGSVWDLCHCLWTQKPLSVAPKTTNASVVQLLFKSLGEEEIMKLRQVPLLKKSLSIVHGTAFVPFLISFPALCGNNASNAASVKKELLVYLSDRGLHGLDSFLRTFVQPLART